MLVIVSVAAPPLALAQTDARHPFDALPGGAGLAAIGSASLQASDSRDANGFGVSVSVSGDTAVVGAPLASDFGQWSGAAYVFVRDHGGPDAWGEVVKLVASDAALGNRFGNQFGHSVAIDGDTIIVGAVGTSQVGQFTGTAYVFERNHGGPNAWGEVAKLTADAPGADDYFGGSVAVDGDVAIVGARETDVPRRRPGSAYVFLRHQGGTNKWGRAARLTAPDGSDGAQFGFSVAVSGDTVVVGAPFAPDSQAPFAGGAAYVFTRGAAGAGPWTFTARLRGRDRTSVLGWSVALDGDVAVAGDPGVEAALVYGRHTGGTHAWGHSAALRPDDPQHDEDFGYAVAVAGDTVVVGAPEDDEKGGRLSRSGSAYLFGRRPGGADRWSRVLKLTNGDGLAGHQLGWHVALSSGRAVLGAPKFGAQAGAAYVCPLDALSATEGACRRAVPVVDRLVGLSNLQTSCCVNSEYVLTASFTNTSGSPIWRPFFEVYDLRSGFLLNNADGGPGATGAVLTPDVGDGALSPGEAVEVTFRIGMPFREVFWFRVRLRGDPDS